MVDGRTILHTIVQGSTVDLFHSWDIAVAPVDRHRLYGEPVPFHELSATIAFVGNGFTGALTLGVPPEVFTLGRQHAGGRPTDVRDWLRELTNQLCGRIKSRLLHFQVSLQVGLPTSLTREAFDRHRAKGPFFAAYVFRTLRGEAVVTLGGDIRPEVFVYTGTAESAHEGDIILF